MTTSIGGAAVVLSTRLDLWDRLVGGSDPGARATLIVGVLDLVGTVVAAVVAAIVAVRAYRGQQRETRRQQRATFYAEAVQAVEDYAEAPYRIRRRDGSAAARREVTQHVSDVKSRISFYRAWMAIHGTSAIADAYDAFVRAAQAEAGQQMTVAWNGRPTRRDRDVPIGAPLPRPRTDTARAALVTIMKSDLVR